MVWLVRHQDVENSTFYMYKNPRGQENNRRYKVGAANRKQLRSKAPSVLESDFQTQHLHVRMEKKIDNAVQ